MNARPTLARSLITRFTLVVVAVLAVLGFALDRVIERTLLDDLTDSLVAEARAVRRTFPEEEAALQPTVRQVGRELGARITVIRTDGVVLADSERDPATMENHRDRPEVRAARAGSIGVASRFSETVGERFRYVALPSEGSRIVRVALPLSIVAERLSRVRWIIVIGTSAAVAAAVLIVSLVARAVTRPVERITGSVSAMAEGDLRARAPEEGTRELALLASTLNQLAEELSRRIEQVDEDRRMRDSILSAMQEGVALLEGDTVQYANPAAARLLGGVPAGLRSLAPSPLRLLVEEARAGPGVRSDEIVTTAPPRTLEAAAAPVGHRVLLVLRDVTEQRRVGAMRRDFVADASHELKTPVASIRATAETLRSALEDDPASARGFAERVEREAERLSRIVSDLLDLSRLEAERPEMRRVRLDHIVAGELQRFQERAHRAGIELTLEAEPVTVSGDEKALSLLLANLVDNAIRYTGPSGRVDVAVEATGGGAVLRVADTGVGIPSRELPRIFERFYRVDRARSRETGGTGLGLSIARHVAEQHGGRIEVESELDRGSTFRVHLPAATE